MPGTNSPLLSYLIENEPAFRRPRLAALYSDFRRLETTNPDGYAANVKAWQQAFVHAARAGVLPSLDTLSINISEDLLRDLESKEWGRPLALGAVVREGLRQRDIIPATTFKNAEQSIYYRSWSLNPLNLVGWGLRQLGVVGDSYSPLPTGRFILLENLEGAGKRLSKRIEQKRGRVERVYSRAQFLEFSDVFGVNKLSESDIETLLRFLQRDKGILVYNSRVVKFLNPGDSAEITQEDITIASLKELIQRLGSQTKLLETKTEGLGIAARDAVSRKNKVSAVAALRSKKLTESVLAQRHATLSQLEEVFNKIEQAVDQVEVVRIMEGSIKVLAGLNSEIGGVQHVDDILDGLREQVSQVDEIGNILVETIPGRAIDETEVDDELEKLEREEAQKQENLRREKVLREAEKTRIKLNKLETANHQLQDVDVTADNEGKKHPVESDKELMEGMKRISLDPPEQIPS